MPDDPAEISELLDALRAGDRVAQDRALRHFEPWLGLLAEHQLATRFRRKFDPADIVQQTLVEAHRGMPRFRGRSSGELAVWLRRILASVLAQEVRRLAGAQRRDLARERSLDDALAQTSAALAAWLPSGEPSPSGHAAAQDDACQLARALGELPEDDRRILLLRHVEGLPHAEIAERVGLRPGTVRMRWVRALERLRRSLGDGAR